MLTRNQLWNGLPAFSQSVDSFEDLRREMDRLLFDFSRDYGTASRDSAADSTQYTAGRVSWKDSGNAFVLRAELPGLTEKDVEITANSNTLTVRAERKVEPLKGYSAHRRERQTFYFARSFELPAKVDPDAVEAVMKNGVLTLTLPKAPEAQPKRISVKAS
jgi:HSP20 family protein